MAVAGRRVPLVAAEPRAGDISASIGDPAHAAALLGFTAATPLEAGLRTLLDHLEAADAASADPG